MGTVVQTYGLAEDDFRGEDLADHPNSLKGNNDILSLVRPGLVRSIHEAYLEAGADIITTNTFTATRISQADYGTQALAYDINVAAARLACAGRA